MDLVVMRRLAAELDERLRGGRIEQVWALPRNDVVIAIERRSGPRLWFSSEPDEPHLYLREGAHPTPERPPGFAMAARNLLVGRRIGAIEPLHGDRIVQLACAGEEPARLVFELIPRRAGAYLIDGDGAIKAVWQPRRGRPDAGETYRPPGPDTRPSLDQVAASTWESLRAAPDADALVRGLLRAIAGMSPLVAREIAARCAAGEELTDAAATELTRAAEAATEAGIYAPGDLEALDTLPPARCFLLAPYPLRHLETSGVAALAKFPSLLDAAASFYPRRVGLAVLETARTELGSALELTLAKLHRTRDAVATDADQAGDPETQRLWADLLLAYPNARREGDAVRVPDPHGGEAPGELTIPIDPSLSRVDNAQAYYNRARRAERAAARTAMRRARLGARIEAVGDLLGEARCARDIGACRRLARAARSHGVAVASERWVRPESAMSSTEADSDGPPTGRGRRPETRSKRQRRAPAAGAGDGPPGIESFTSADGFQILVGRNARANERLTHKLAAPHDFWLHAEGPGSHVLIRNPGRAEQPGPDALRQAAALAAYFSRARGATKVNVRWTQARHVKKPRGAPAGQVILRRSQTVLAEPVAPEELFADDSEE